MISSLRRRLVRAAAVLPFLPTAALAQGAPRTPACGAQTEPQTAGPFFKTASPQRSSLVDAKSTGMRMVVSGRVLAPDCRPVANAKLDFWHASEHGAYDNRTYRYRGHQFTDGEGRYRLETIRPAEYPGRTRHIHVKVQAPNGPTLTTQLYFPGEGLNKVDPLYRKELEMKMANGAEGAFDFVVDT